jgi:hypothetical protein
MYELSTNDVAQVSGGLMMRPPGVSYNRCVAGFTLGGSLFGAAIGVGSTWGFGGMAGFTVGGTLGAAAGAYFCE